MKYIITLCLALALSGCASKKKTVSFFDGEHKLESPCPSGGQCKLDITKNKSLDIKTDGTGKLYYSLKDDPGKIVVHYTFTKGKGNYQDGEYQESIIFETDENFSNFNKGRAQDTNMLFGVNCFCRKAGYYKVDQGSVLYYEGRLTVYTEDNIVPYQQINTFKAVLKK